jgi:hypothetical protein
MYVVQAKNPSYTQIIMKRGFIDRFSKHPQISNLSAQWESGCLHADRQTDMTKLTVALRHSAKAPKNRDLELSKFTLRTTKHTSILKSQSTRKVQEHSCLSAELRIKPQDVWERGCITPRIPNLSTKCR